MKEVILSVPAVHISPATLKFHEPKLSEVSTLFVQKMRTDRLSFHPKH